MKDTNLLPDGDQVGASLRCQTAAPRRILVVDDDEVIRQLNAKTLMEAGYVVDAAEHGSLAWDMVLGTHVVAIGSVIPLKVIGENGIPIIAAGQQFARTDGKMLCVSTNAIVNDLIQLDELQAATDLTDAKEPSSKP